MNNAIKHSLSGLAMVVQSADFSTLDELESACSSLPGRDSSNQGTAVVNNANTNAIATEDPADFNELRTLPNS
jgi:hypothetical protein